MGRKSTIWRNKEVTKKLGFISLGCSKNLVDTEMMVGIMEKAGYELTEDLAEAHVIIINTCTFIDPAKEESIQTILETAEYKKTGVCERLVAAGCLSQQYKEALAKEIPEVDIFIGTDSWQDILDAVNESYANGGEKVFKFGTIPCANEELIPRASLTPKYTAYVKIAEGCSNGCTFCYIPYVRGPMRSRPISSIVHEVRRLAAEGVREFNLIAQDLSCYGRDLGTNLASLLRELVKIEGVKWIRLSISIRRTLMMNSWTSSCTKIRSASTWISRCSISAMPCSLVCTAAIPRRASMRFFASSALPDRA